MSKQVLNKYTGDKDWFNDIEYDKDLWNININTIDINNRIDLNRTDINLLWWRVTNLEVWLTQNVIVKDWSWNNITLNFTKWRLIWIT